MIRRADWEPRLSEYLGDRLRDAVFVWGESDCAMFCAGAVLAMTDVDILADFRERYSTATGSMRALKRRGFADLATLMDDRLPPRPIGMARRGDIVMHDGAVGVCIGADALFVGTEEGVDGLVRVSRAFWSHAWSVGE